MRRLVLAAALLLASLLGIIGISILALSADACPTTTGGTADQASASATGFIPPDLPPIFADPRERGPQTFQHRVLRLPQQHLFETCEIQLVDLRVKIISDVQAPPEA